MDEVVLYFSAKWCGPCRQMVPIVSDAKKRTDKKIKKVDVDVDSELATKYNITNIPTFLKIKDGNVVNKHVGAMSQVELVEFCES